ncbi:hypothetical protein FRZ03_20890 [Streptomyces misionensis]|uniref:Uncharacterized protein n=1 Tax=Streptomyces misionensis TaxID=67331 RepID=A0A5C6JK84_9ACTN|nr:hypothetical protein FRZ03_20890 [Streptomyces misionensis]
MRFVTVLVGAGLLWSPWTAQALAAPGAGHAYCGVDRASGLGVTAARGVPCGVALQVAAAYTKGWRTEVRAAGARWRCGERQGDPDPYQACADVHSGGRVVTLVS